MAKFIPVSKIKIKFYFKYKQGINNYCPLDVVGITDNGLVFNHLNGQEALEKIDSASFFIYTLGKWKEYQLQLPHNLKFEEFKVNNQVKGLLFPYQLTMNENSTLKSDLVLARNI